MLVHIPTNIADQRIADLFVAALEGGSTAWLRKARHVSREKMGTEQPWYADPVMYSGKFQIALTFDDPKTPGGDGEGHTIITDDDVAKAIALMVTRHPSHFADFTCESDDANTADIFMQLVVFGEVVYG